MIFKMVGGTSGEVFFVEADSTSDLVFIGKKLLPNESISVYVASKNDAEKLFLKGLVVGLGDNSKPKIRVAKSFGSCLWVLEHNFKKEEKLQYDITKF